MAYKEELIPKPPHDRRPDVDHPNPYHYRVWRDKIWFRDRARCQNCGIYDYGYDTKFSVHHTTYERFGNEALEDGVLVCDPCHQIITEETRRRRGEPT